MGSSPVTVDPQALEQIANPQGSTIAARKASVGRATEQAVRGVREQKIGGGIGRGVAGLGAGILTSIIASKLFGGKESQNIDPSVQLALAQQLGGGGGQGGGPAASSRALIDVSRLVTILKGIQQLGNLQGPVAQSGGRLI